jgi:hypothetical protein
MAGRSDAATDRVSLASAPSLAAFTVMGWVKVVNSVSPFFHEIVRFSDAGASSNLILGMTGAAGLTPRTYSSGSTSGVVAGTAYTLGQWVFVCSSHNGSAAALYHGATPGSLTKVTGTVTVGTPNQLTLFSRSASDGSEWLDGSLAYVRMYTAVLSDAEIAAESQSATAVRTSGLWAHYPLAAAALTDTSGNARNLTAGTTALSSDTDPALGTSFTDAGTATLTTTATGTQLREAAASGTATTALTTSGAQVREATQAGTASLSTTATGIQLKEVIRAGTAPIALTATGTAAREAFGALSATLTLSATGLDVREAAALGSALVALTGSGTQLAERLGAGTALLTLLATGVQDQASDFTDAGTATLRLTATGIQAGVEVPAAELPTLSVLSNLVTISVRESHTTLGVQA